MKIYEGSLVHGGTRFSYLDNQIEGDDVLLLHGHCSFKEQFKSLMLKNKSHRYVALDLPGHGTSSLLKEYTPENILEKVLEFLNLYNLKPKKIVGHSLGGHLALWLMEHLNDIEITLLSTVPLNNDSFKFNPFKINKTTEVFSMDDIDVKALQARCKNLTKNKDLLDLIVQGFQLSDDKLRVSKFPSFYKKNNIDEIKLISKSNKPIPLYYGVNDEVINIDYLARVKKHIGENLILNSIDQEGHYFDTQKVVI